jgi:hypothetical protein
VTREEYDKNRAEYEREKGSSTIGFGRERQLALVKTRAACLTTNDLGVLRSTWTFVNDV